MQKMTAYLSGRIQKSGYRSKVVTIARVLGICGYVKNLADGRVKVVAEGEVSDLEKFAKALVMKDAIIDVTGIEKQYGEPSNDFDDFDKIVSGGETDERLDSAVDHLKVLIDLTKQGLGKQDQMLGKQDQMLNKQDQILCKQDDLIEKMDETKVEVVGEVRELRSDLKTSLDDRLSRMESDVAQIKAKIGLY
jgi:acylphosphatase